jgi:hypothetical protein
MSVKMRQRIHWTNAQKKQIIEEAIRLYSLYPEWSNLQLLREAQKILPTENQRHLVTVCWSGSFKWFADGVEEEIVKSSKSTPVHEELIFPLNEKYTEPESLPPNEVVDLSVTSLLSTLVKAMEELREETMKGLPIGIVGRLDDLQKRLDKIESRVERFLDQGLLVRLVPAQVGIPDQLAVNKEVPVEEVKKPPVVVESENKTRKPRVLVLNTKSGHVRHGIEIGTLGYVSSIKFLDTYGIITPKFDEYDYILAYKKTPLPWVEAAKKFYPPNKFRAVSGGAIQVATVIKSLLPVEITDSKNLDRVNNKK